MKIGIDIDDTICRTTEIVHDRLEKYSKKVKLNPLDIMNDEDLKQDFFNEYLEDIYQNVEIKHDVAKVLNRIKNRGNELYIITSRNTKNSKEITKKWLEKNNIKVNEIIIDVYGDTKAKVCKQKKIDLMIEDNPYNYKAITAMGIKCLLFDDREKYDLKNDYITNWIDIERYIERNR